MSVKLRSYLQSKSVRHYHSVVAFAIVGVLLGGSLVHVARELAATHPPLQSERAGVEDVIVGPYLPPAVPVALRIPEVGIETSITDALGINADQTIAVPDSYETVGWYKHAPTPGERGPAVILGHVDSYEGPAVFWPLRQLAPGDEIFIDRADGTTATFTVTHLEDHDQADFPTAKVYGDIDHAGLRLITCSGVYDNGTLRYSHNLIVFARLEQTGENIE